MASADEPRVVYITATPQNLNVPAAAPTDVGAAPSETQVAPRIASPVPLVTPAQLTPDPARFALAQNTALEHVVQSGETLTAISAAYGLSIDSILEVNEFANPDILSVGQVVRLPEPPSDLTPGWKLLPDSKLVRAPGSPAFDTAAFIAEQPGYIRIATDEVETRQADGSRQKTTLNAAQIVDRVSREFSVDPRLLLAMLEYRAGWLSNADVPQELRSHPFISEDDSGTVDRAGMYRQLAWAANQLNWGYYGWKYRGWTTLEFEEDGGRLLFAPGLNAGTVALQHFFALFQQRDDWEAAVVPSGFYSTYYSYFGDPFEDALEPLVPPDLEQPPLTLPFRQGETWFYTGGHHGGWGSGSAWAAVDFAPPDEVTDGVACYTSDYEVTAVAPGIIARSGGGVVVLDLDGDGDESTGWTVLYLHLASTGRIAEGTRVEAGDRVGYAACEGGFSTATHLHIGRRYNGEWIPADCEVCAPHHARPDFTMSGWTVVGLPKQEYQGFLVHSSGDRRVAEQGRLTPDNRISW
jgi:murein DD-endopeptidase MepM/ murein hydrolase activator NlpD